MESRASLLRQGEGQQQARMGREALEGVWEPAQEQRRGVERNRFPVALTSGLLRDVLDRSGHNFNYVSCKLFSHLALTALNTAWLSR